MVVRLLVMVFICLSCRLGRCFGAADLYVRGPYFSTPPPKKKGTPGQSDGVLKTNCSSSGAANSGWLVDRISRKYSIVVASIVFIIGSILQAASIGYRIILCGRLVGGIGVGMLSMVAPL